MAVEKPFKHTALRRNVIEDPIKHEIILPSQPEDIIPASETRVNTQVIDNGEASV